MRSRVIDNRRFEATYCLHLLLNVINLATLYTHSAVASIVVNNVQNESNTGIAQST
jgi:hypothetical protein